MPCSGLPIGIGVYPDRRGILRASLRVRRVAGRQCRRRRRRRESSQRAGIGTGGPRRLAACGPAYGEG